MRLVTVELHARDVETMTAFYRDVIGIGLQPGDDERTHYETFWGGSWAGDEADAAEGNDQFLFFAIQPLAPPNTTPTTGAEIGFDVPDLDAAHTSIVETAGEAIVLEPPTDRPWGRVASYRDPQGNVVQLNGR